MLRPIFASATLLLAAAPACPQAASTAPATYTELHDVHWSYEPSGSPDARQPQLRFVRDGMTITLGREEIAGFLGQGAAASLASPGEAVSFNLAREAGALACTGMVSTPGRAAGTCRFDPSERFIAALAERRLVPEDSSEMLSLTLVGARIAPVDALSRAGFRIDEVEDVIVIAALELTAGFASDLRAAGLRISELDDLVAAKAVGVDPAWLSGMAEAGYPDLDVDQAIQMRALDVTPDYAQRMKRVVAALEESPSE